MLSAPPELPREWRAVELPGYRPIPERPATYWPFAHDELPPVPARRGDALRWLESAPEHEHSIGDLPDPEWERSSGTTWTELERRVGDRARELSGDFKRFLDTPELQRRVRSCTGCYLELGECAVATADGGLVMHFLADSQWVANWHLYAGPGGESVVVGSALGFEHLPPEPDDVADMAVCATSFSEFLYRFWIENEIWYALTCDSRPLTAEERAYVEHYARLHGTSAPPLAAGRGRFPWSRRRRRH